MCSELAVGGLVPFSATDLPGALAAVVFCQGCPWRCAYCHNPHLIPREAGDIPWAAVLDLLERRRGLLDGVVFSGGEPTLQAGLKDAMEAVRERGYRVGLHTAGPYPERLAAVLPWVDWVGFDVKAPFAAYSSVTGLPGSGEKARESLGLLLASGVAYEVRTTFHPALLDEAALEALMEELRSLGVARYALQAFRPPGCANETLCAAPLPPLPSVGEGRFPAFLRRE